MPPKRATRVARQGGSLLALHVVRPPHFAELLNEWASPGYLNLRLNPHDDEIERVDWQQELRADPNWRPPNFRRMVDDTLRLLRRHWVPGSHRLVHGSWPDFPVRMITEQEMFHDLGLHSERD